MYPRLLLISLLPLFYLSCSTNSKKISPSFKYTKRLPASRNFVPQDTLRKDQQKVTARYREQAQNLVNGTRFMNTLRGLLERGRNQWTILRQKTLDIKDEISSITQTIKEEVTPNIRRTGQLTGAIASQQVRNLTNNLKEEVLPNIRRTGQLAGAIIGQQVRNLITNKLEGEVTLLSADTTDMTESAREWAENIETQIHVTTEARKLTDQGGEGQNNPGRVRLEQFLNELEDKDIRPRRLFQDFQQLETDLRLSQIELTMISDKLQQILNNSLIGTYLQEREKAILGQACEQVTQCTQRQDHSTNDDSRLEQQIENIQDILPIPNNNTGTIGR